LFWWPWRTSVSFAVVISTQRRPRSYLAHIKRFKLSGWSCVARPQNSRPAPTPGNPNNFLTEAGRIAAKEAHQSWWEADVDFVKRILP